jgi:hypothetical protein
MGDKERDTGREEGGGMYGNRHPNAVTTIVFDFRDIWMPQMRYREMEKSVASDRMSSAAMNCQRAKRLPHIAVVVSSHGSAGWQRMATRRVEITAQTPVRAMVLHIAIEWPFPGVRRRKRKAVESLVKKSVTM